MTVIESKTGTDGRVVAIAGPVIDVEFPRGSLPQLNSALQFDIVTDGKPVSVLVAVVQRFGAALNLNVHIHALVMDGVFAPDRSGGVSFRAHERHDDDLGPLLVTIQRRIEALLNRRGMSDSGEGFDAPDRWAEDTPALAGLAAASVRGAVGGADAATADQSGPVPRRARTTRGVEAGRGAVTRQ